MEKEINDAKAQAQEYLFQLLNQRNTNVIEYENKINKEIAELKEKHSVNQFLKYNFSKKKTFLV